MLFELSLGNQRDGTKAMFGKARFYLHLEHRGRWISYRACLCCCASLGEILYVFTEEQKPAARNKRTCSHCHQLLVMEEALAAL